MYNRKLKKQIYQEKIEEALSHRKWQKEYFKELELTHPLFKLSRVPMPEDYFADNFESIDPKHHYEYFKFYTCDYPFKEEKKLLDYKPLPEDFQQDFSILIKSVGFLNLKNWIYWCKLSIKDSKGCVRFYKAENPASTIFEEYRKNYTLTYYNKFNPRLFGLEASAFDTRLLADIKTRLQSFDLYHNKKKFYLAKEPLHCIAQTTLLVAANPLHF